ncbi:MAG: arginine--tRNA ligase [Candidatus Omnitrophica bacterium]|nr:arginine--tRNA ligase [Candidatus Omnitrophota bacterium]
MKQVLNQWIKSSLAAYAQQKELSISDLGDFEIIVSKDSTQGDFASNVAFKLSRLTRQPPKKSAEDFFPTLKNQCPASVDRIEIGGAGFINIYLVKSSLTDILREIREKDSLYGQSEYGVGKKALVEFVSANPTGPLTIAHGRQAIIGDTLVRLLRTSGYQADAEYYLNDAGRQMNLLGQSLWARYCQELGVEKPIPEEGYQGDYLAVIAKALILEKGKSLLENEITGIEACRLYAQETIMKGILEDLNTVDVHFQNIFSERTLYQNKSIEAAFEDLRKAGHLYEQDGALWFKTTAFGDDKDRVVRKSTGELTYIAPDIAYHREKFNRGYHWLVDLMGPDHHGYIVRLKAACSALGFNPDQLDIRIVQLTTLYRKGEPVRMSTRSGEFVMLRELVQEVGADAARFFFLMRKVESHLDFDLDLAKEKSQDNPVYYLQYAHARISSLLRHAAQSLKDDANTERLVSPEETELIKHLYDYVETIVHAAQTLEPYRLVEYLRDLAASFHKFYSVHRVLSEDAALSQARLILIDAVRIVLRNGLNLLGVSAPESM